jgi:hypothetical protein
MFGGRRGILIVNLLISLSAALAFAQPTPPSALPSPSFPVPASHPANPPGWNAFHPPLSQIAISPSAPTIAECNAAAGPDDTVSITGNNLDAGTTFLLFTQTNASNAAILNGQIQDSCPAGDLVTIPSAALANSMYLLWPKSSAGDIGAPVAINRPQAWWLSTESASPGQTISVFGRSLSNGATTPASWVYIEPSNSNGADSGQWATVSAVNPYKVDFTLPTTLAPAAYRVWVNNGLGENLCWSGPIALDVKPQNLWSGPTLNVKDFGAVADGKSDDAPAILKALSALQPGGTLHFPAGEYCIASGQLNVPSNARLTGDGPDRSILRFQTDIVALYKQFGKGPYVIGAPDGWDGHLGAQDIEFDSLGLSYGGPSKTGAIVRQRFGAHLKFTNCTFLAGGLTAIDWLGSSDLAVHGGTFQGKGVDALSVHHLMIDQTHFFLANGAEEAITIWNGHDIAITRCTVQNQDDTATDASLCGQGRFLENGLVWGSIYHEYVADNATLRIGAPHAGNAGEQLCNEATQYAFSGNPVSATAATLTVVPRPSSPSSWAGWNVIVTSGAGLGQLRTITGSALDESRHVTLALDRPWNVTPDAHSHVQICTTLHDCVFFNNTFQCLTGPSGATNAGSPTGLWAATGLELWTGGWGIVFDHNRTENLNDGVLLASDDNTRAAAFNPCYFVDIINNQINASRQHGICFQPISPTAQSHDPDFIGVAVRRNHIDGRIPDSSNLFIARQRPEGMRLVRGAPTAQATLSVLEHNIILNVPVGIGICTDPDSLLYDNTLTAGAAAGPTSEAIAAGNRSPAIRLKGNVYQGFNQTTPPTLASDPAR